MDLWTDYEGRTIDGTFPLKKLLLPEGRSAFFSTTNAKGLPTVIRLIEAHFDEEEILSRWRGVELLEHPNLLRLEKFGQVIVDETSVVYAVMEPVEANLGEVLSQQRLSLADTKQLATSLIAALETLHSHGFVHEHIEPANVLAVGEVVKLRSDCIRETPAGEEGGGLQQRDAHDLSVVLLQALTQQSTLEGAAAEPPLPAPFDRIIPKGIRGEWGLQEISNALVQAERPAAAPAPQATEVPVQRPQPSPKPSAPQVVAAKPMRVDDVEAAHRSRRPETEIKKKKNPIPHIRVILAVAVAVLLLLWIGWYFLHNRPEEQSEAQQQAAASAATSTTKPAKPAPAPVVTTKPVQTAKTNAPSVDKPHGQWRVIAYTYNREKDAQKKQSTLSRKRPGLQAEVFTPNGRAPYLVTVGGWMSQDEAFALAKRARGEGLPRDTYATNAP